MLTCDDTWAVFDVVQMVYERGFVNVSGVLVEGGIDSLVHADRDDPGLDLLMFIVLSAKISD